MFIRPQSFMERTQVYLPSIARSINRRYSDKIDKFGLSQLHYAIMHGSTLKAKKMIQIHCGINKPDYAGRTPIQLAVFYGRLSLVEALFKENVLLDTVDNRKNSLLHFLPIQLSKSHELVNVFKKQSLEAVPTNKINDFGVSPLLTAIELRNWPAFSFIKNLGADTKVKYPTLFPEKLEILSLPNDRPITLPEFLEANIKEETALKKKDPKIAELNITALKKMLDDL